MDYKAIHDEIYADADCAPYINDGTDPARRNAFSDDAKIAEIRNAKRQKVVSKIFTDKTIRDSLSVTDAYLMIKTLKDIAAATVIPDWLTTTLTAANIAVADHPAYFDMMQSAWDRLRADGLDIGSSRTLNGLAIIASGLPEVANAAHQLSLLAYEKDDIDGATVSIALRGPWR